MNDARRFAIFGASLLVTSLSFQTAQAQDCVPLPHGLIGWWPANGTAEDVVASNDGQLGGDATFAPAVVDLGFLLDGLGDYVEIPDSPALRPALVSAEAWVRFDNLDTPIVSQFGVPGTQFIIFKKNTRIFNFEGYSLHKERVDGVDRLAFRVTDASGFGNIAVSTTAVQVGQFYHVVGTYDGSQVRIYVNGVLEADAPASIVLDYSTRPLFIGTSGETVFDGKLNGVADEASIYSRALNASEVAALYAAGPAGKCLSASGLISNLAAFVQTLNLSTGIANSLDAKLQNLLQALDDTRAGDTPSACHRVGAFVNEVAAQTGKTLTEAQAAHLTDSARQIQDLLGCQ